MSIWDDLDKEAAKDDRVGTHDFIIDKVTEGYWPSGDPFIELEGRLTTHENLNLRSRFSPEPSEDQAAEIIASKDRRAIRSANYAHIQAVMLQEQYGKSLAELSAGDTLRVKVDYEDKDKKYVKIAAILPKTASLSSNGNSSDVPF
jgi:hypothetical protein